MSAKERGCGMEANKEANDESFEPEKRANEPETNMQSIGCR